MGERRRRISAETGFPLEDAVECLRHFAHTVLRQAEDIAHAGAGAFRSWERFIPPPPPDPLAWLESFVPPPKRGRRKRK